MDTSSNQHHQPRQNNTAIVWSLAFLAAAVIAFAYVLYHNHNKDQIATAGNSNTQSNGGSNGAGSPNPAPASDCYSADESWNHYGENHCVSYYVGDPFKSSAGNVFLNEKRDFTSGFTAVIFSSGPSCGNPVSDFGFKTVEVTGSIQEYQNHPEIVINDCSQIKVAS